MHSGTVLEKLFRSSQSGQNACLDPHHNPNAVVPTTYHVNSIRQIRLHASESAACRTRWPENVNPIP